MSVQIALSAKIKRCREFVRDGNKHFVLTISHFDDDGAETVLQVNSDRPIGEGNNLHDLLVELQSYKKADAFQDRQSGQVKPFLRDVPAFRLV